ncbi:hypothetical protein ScPMuIL_006021 [Solemya velum]
MAATFWGQLIKFKEVPDDQRIEVLPFLAASKAIVVFVESLGKAFYPVKKDISGNIEKLEKKHAMNPGKFMTFNDMLEEELANKSTDLATVGGLWLKRALEFIAGFLQNIADSHYREPKEENIRPLILAAYEPTLQRYHGWVTKKIFSAVARAAPYRKDMMLIYSLGVEGIEDQVVKDIETYLVTMKSNLSALSKLFIDLGLDVDGEV